MTCAFDRRCPLGVETGTASDFDEAARHERELNERQREILRLIEAGHTNREVADMLGISIDGAKWNVSEILGKLGLNSREEAADYWRWRHEGVGSRLRGWFGVPLLRLAVGGTAVTVASVIAIAALLQSGNDAPSGGRLTPGRPFVLEARVTQYDRSLAADQPLPEAAAHQTVEKQHSVRWWHRDADHTRWDVTQAVSRGVSGDSTSFVADGQQEWSIDRDQQKAFFQPLQPNAERSVGSLIPFGPSYERDVQAMLQALRNRTETGGHAEIVGSETLLGRETVIVEFGVEERYWSGEGWFLTKLNRLWVDPETMMVLRNESDSGRFIAEVTSLAYEQDPGDAAFVYQPPPAFIVRPVTTNPPGYTPDPYGGMKLLAPFLRPGYLPNGFELESLMTVGTAGEPGSTTDTRFETEDGTSVRLEQTVTPMGLPRSVTTRMTGAYPTTFRGRPALEDDRLGSVRLAWWEDGIAIMLSSDTVGIAALRAVGEGLSLGPTPATVP